MMTKKSTKELLEKPKRARITLECSTETRKSIRIMAAQQDKSMNDFILSTIAEKLKQKN